MITYIIINRKYKGADKMKRDFMKSSFGTEIETDQSREIPQPDLVKSYDKNRDKIDLPEVDEDIISNDNIFQAILERKSHRIYSDEKVTLKELSYLLTMTQRIKEIRGDNYVGLRPVPSAGGRHPYETYLAILNVEGLRKGIYRYLPLDHKLLLVKEVEDLENKIVVALNNQKFTSKAALIFIWACIPYRTEWRYGDRAYKIALLDAGHIGQALYLACETIGLGACAIASYGQEIMDNLVGVDGEEEFSVYTAVVGKV